MSVTNWTPIVELQTGQDVSDNFDAAFENIDNAFIATDEAIADIADKNKLHGVTNPNTPILSINVDTTKYQVVPLTYYIQGVEYTYAGATLSSGFGQAGDFITIGIDASGLVTKINSFFTPSELTTTLELGAIASSDGTNITSVGDGVFFSDEYMQNLYIRFKSFEGASFFDGVSQPSVNATNNNTMDIKGGTASSADMQTTTIVPEVQVAGYPIYNIAGDVGIRALQDPLLAENIYYDNGTQLETIPTGHYAQHSLMYSFRTGAYYLQYGQNTYSRLSDAMSQDPINSLFEIQGSEVELLAKVIVQEGTTSIVSLIDIRDKRNDVIGLVPVQADRIELEAQSLVDQLPTGTDIPIQVSFGAIQDNDNIAIDALGTITCKTKGNYVFELSLQYSRTSNTGEAILLSRVLVNDVLRGHVSHVHLDGNSDAIPLSQTSTIFLEVNDTYKVEIYRDSSGNNDGGLYSQVSAIGWETSPSSCLIITSKD